MPIRIGIDFGGTKTELVALDLNNGKELYSKRIPTVRDDYRRTISDICDLVFEAEDVLGESASVGMGMTGCVDKRTQLAKNANTTWVNGNPLIADLGAALNRTVRIENDANCFAVSEAADGAGAGKEVVFGVIIGTGCGGGVVVNGKSIQGTNTIAGQWGHNPLPYPIIKARSADNKYFDQPLNPNESPIKQVHKDKSWLEHPGEICFCGKRGCLETWISGTGFKMDYQRVEKEEISTHDIIANARAGEPKACAALERYVDRLARALSTVINLIDPDIIVLGGGMSNVDELYDLLPKALPLYVDSDEVHTEIVPPKFGDSSGVRGAAWLWNNEDHHLGLPLSQTNSNSKHG